EESGQTFGEMLFAAGDEPVFVTGKLEVDLNDEGGVSRFKILAETVQPIMSVREEKTHAVELLLRDDQLTAERILALKHIVADHRGTCTMRMKVTVGDRYTSEVVFGDEFKVVADDSLIHNLERLFDGPVARLV